MSGRLAGHVAAVTGGAQGIGRAHAARLAAEGGQADRLLAHGLLPILLPGRPFRRYFLRPGPAAPD